MSGTLAQADPVKALSAGKVGDCNVSIRLTSLLIILMLGSICIVLGALRIQSLFAELSVVRAAAAAGSATERLNKAIIELSSERSLMQVGLNLPDPISDELKTQLKEQRALANEGFQDALDRLANSPMAQQSESFGQSLSSLQKTIYHLRNEADALLETRGADRPIRGVLQLPVRMKDNIEEFVHLPLMLRTQDVRLPSQVVTLEDIQQRAWEVREYGGQERTYLAIAAATGEAIPPTTLSEMEILHRQVSFALTRLQILSDFDEVDHELRGFIRETLNFYDGPYRALRESMIEASIVGAPCLAPLVWATFRAVL